MIIRTERSEESGAIYELIREAFRTARVSDGTEQDFADGLRKGGNYVPELALVAEEEGRLIGQVMLTKIGFVAGGEERCGLLLAPVSVKLEWRDKGVGAELIREAMRRAEEMEFGAVFLVGAPEYYGRFGFRETGEFGVKNLSEIPDRYVLGCELREGALKDGGSVKIV